MCDTGFCDEPLTSGDWDLETITLRSIKDGEVLSREDLPRWAVYGPFDAKVNEYLNCPVSMSGTSVQAINPDGSIFYETHID
jgi:hypothetical protein